MTNPLPPGVATRLLLELAEDFGVKAEVGELLAQRGGTMPELGPMLRTHRKSLNMPYYAVTACCGLSASQLVMFENGKQLHPGLRTIHALAYGYGLPFGEVLAAALRTAGGPEPVYRKRTRPSALQG
ncbi:hypothetical protein [Cypionkella sinensis]|uniref:HTH cro/C1-type domain-containing protein n=1 Tax=Cypionkella sinensis TaxID=1756043 RepID=A0ABV7J0M8_9RHOB